MQVQNFAATLSTALAVLLAVLLAAPDASAGGRDLALQQSSSASADLGTIAPSLVFKQAQFSPGGLTLRNCGGGAIHIVGAVQPVQQAFLCWGVITKGAAPQTVTALRIQRIYPQPVSQDVEVRGTVAGAGLDPCSKGVNGGDTITIFRGAVPLTVANGNGTYLIRLNPDAGGSTGGEDPIIASPLPAWSGASLVVVGTGTGKVGLFDSGLAGRTFLSSAGLAYALPLGVDVAETSRIIFHNIGANGQTGDGVKPLSATASETMSINGVHISGAGSGRNDGGWNGTAAALPQLWDDTGYDITSAAQQGAGNRLSISIAGPADGDDCLTAVANAGATFPVFSATRATRMPDLVVTHGTVVPRVQENVIVGRRIVRFDWGQKTKNIGTKVSPRSKTAVDFVESTPNVALLSVPRLASGTASRLRLGTFEHDFRPYKFGTYRTRICADGLGVVVESDESNNCRKDSPIHLVPGSFSGRVTGSHHLFGQVFLLWDADVTYDFATRILDGDTVRIDYLFSDVSVNFTLRGAFDTCTWNGAGTDSPPAQTIRLWFSPGRGKYKAENITNSNFKIPLEIKCTGAPVINTFHDLSRFPWFHTNGFKQFNNPGLEALEGGSTFGTTSTSWNLDARD